MTSAPPMTASDSASSAPPLEGQVAVVTGAGRGIGRATALALAAAGMRVCVAARTGTEIEETTSEIVDRGGQALARRTDVTDYAACTDLVAHATSTWDAAPTVLVNNAGGGDTACLLVDTDPADWTATVLQNLVGSYHMCHAVLPGMIASGAGRIVNIGSGTGYGTVRGTSAYGSAKASVAHLTRILAAEVWQHGIEVNEVVPGPVATRLTQDHFREGEPPKIAPSERVKQPHEVADLVAWLVQRPAGGPTGQMFSLARRALL